MEKVASFCVRLRMKMVKKPDAALLNLVHSFYLCDWREITSKARKGHSLLKEATDFLLLTYKITFKREISTILRDRENFRKRLEVPRNQRKPVGGGGGREGRHETRKRNVYCYVYSGRMSPHVRQSNHFIADERRWDRVHPE